MIARVPSLRTRAITLWRADARYLRRDVLIWGHQAAAQGVNIGRASGP